MKAHRFQLIVAVLLIAVVSLGAYFLFGTFGKSSRIRGEFTEEMMSHLPKTMVMGGKLHKLESVIVTNMAEGPKGYSMDITINWSDGMTTASGAVLQSDGFGRYVRYWNTGEFGPISFAISG